MVKLTIDNKEIEVPEGTTVLEAAKSAGIHIPTLCYHPELTPYGGCRLCLVDVERARTLQPSCTLPVTEGMVVRTNTEEIHEARKFVLDMIFSERNHICPYCVVSGGDCELQNAAYGEEMTHWSFQPNWTPFPVDASHPYIIMDHNRCILCHRCIRACGELAGNFTLGVQERGSKSRVIADLDVPLGESSCISCGACVQVCPTGALIDRWSAYQGKETDVEHNESICVGCSLGCGVDVEVRNNRIVRVEGNWEAEVNGGVLCEIGRFHPLDEQRQRLTSPMIRKGGKLEPVSWNEALAALADQFKPLVGKNGDGAAAMVSTRLSAESLYLFKEIFKDGFKSEMVTSFEEGRYTALSSKLADELGQPFESKLDVLKESDCVVVLGADLVENHQVAGFLVKRAIPQGTKLVVVDPNENELDKLTNLKLKATGGADLDWLQCLSAAVVKSGLAKSELEMDADAALAKAEAATGLSAESYMEIAQVITSAEKPAIVYGTGITEKNSIQTLKALVQLGKLIGAIGADFSNLVSVKGDANSLAAAQYELEAPFALNGHQAVYLAIGDDEPSKQLIQRLEKAPFLAVQASYVSPIFAKADIVLPTAMWAEQEGHYVNMDGRLQKSVKSLEAPEGVKSNQEVLAAIADQLGLNTDDNWKENLLERISPIAIKG